MGETGLWGSRVLACMSGTANIVCVRVRVVLKPSPPQTTNICSGPPWVHFEEAFHSMTNLTPAFCKQIFNKGSRFLLTALCASLQYSHHRP